MFLSGCHLAPAPMHRQKQHFLNKNSLDDITPTRERTQTVNRNPHQITQFLNLAASKAERSQIPEHKVIVSAPGLKFVTVLSKARSKCSGIRNNLFCIDTERRLSNLQESSGNSSDCLTRSIGDQKCTCT